MWHLKKIRRVAKSITNAKTLIRVEAVEVYIWLVNLCYKILYYQPVENNLILERNTDNHHFYELLQSARPIQYKHLGMKISLSYEL